MRKLQVLGLLVAVTMVVGTPSAAADDTQCTGTLAPGVYDDVFVPPGEACTADGGVTITGDVRVLEGAQFLASGTTIGGDVRAVGGSAISQTTLQDSSIGGAVRAGDTVELRIFGGTIGGDVVAEEVRFIVVLPSAGPASIGGNLVIRKAQDTIFDHAVEICAAQLPNGSLRVEKTLRGILIGRPATGCAGVEIPNGDLEVEYNEPNGGGLDIRDNAVAGDLLVRKNEGPEQKAVVGNSVAGTLRCFGNDEPFVGGPNTAQEAEGQCS